MTTITKDGEYTTRSGLPVRIYATDGDGAWPVHAAVKTTGGWEARTYDINGRFGDAGNHPQDLIPKPKTRKLDVWVNVYESTKGILFTTGGGKSREEALAMAMNEPWRIACIHIEREITEGEGLS